MVDRENREGEKKAAGDPPQSVLETLRKSIAPHWSQPVPKVNLRDVGEGDLHSTPFVRPPAAKGAGAGGIPERIGRYQVAGEIARGGVGAILKARDTDLGRDVALKVLLDEHLQNEELLRRFIEEAQIGGQMQHPGIVPIHEMGLLRNPRDQQVPDSCQQQTLGDRPYFTMKLVKGRTLAALLDARREPTEDRQRFLGIFEQVCQTLAYAHSRRVIHRDLKPSNIMVGAFGEVQVMDWGLAKVLAADGAVYEDRTKVERTRVSVIETLRSSGDSSHSLAGSILGTPAYMAPEQARGEIDDVDARSDVFGLGAILCEIITGKPPYVGESAETVFHQAKKGYLDNAYARLDASGADAELVSLARRSIAFEPRDRPPDAGVVAKEFHAYLESLEERARRSALEAARALVRASAERRARRLLALLSTVVVASLLILGGGYIKRQGELRERAGEATRAVEESLAEARRLQGQAGASGAESLPGWEAALGALKRAEALAAPEVDSRVRQEAADLRGTVEQGIERARTAAALAEKKRRLVERLEEIRPVSVEQTREAVIGGEGLAYRKAFQEFGIDVESLPAEEAARLLRQSGIEVELARALDHWARWKKELFGKDSIGWRKLLGIARAADPDAWRARLRQAVEEDNTAELRKLALEPEVKKTSPATLALLASSLREAGDWTEASTVFLACWELHPGDYTINQELGSAFDMAALALKPRNPEAHAALAWTFRSMGDHERASAQFRDAIRLKPDYAGAYTGLGTALSNLRNDGEAVNAFKKAIDLNPYSATAHNNLGVALNRLNDPDGSGREYREAVRLNPTNPIMQGNLGNFLEAKRNLDGAIAAWKEAIRLGPQSFNAETYHENLGRAFLVKNDLERAAYHFKEAARLNPKDISYRTYLARVLAAQGKFAGALSAFAEAVEINPDSSNFEPVSFLARLNKPDLAGADLGSGLDDFIETAEKIFSSGAKHHENLPRAYYLALKLKLERLAPSQALEVARREVEKTTRQSPDALGLLAQAQFRAGDRREAILTLEEAARLEGFSQGLARQLEEYRHALRPDIISFASIDAAVEEQVVLIREGDEWRYFSGHREPSAGLDWTLAGFDDSEWKGGPSGFGYGDDDDATVLGDMPGNYTTVYIRRVLKISDPKEFHRVYLSVIADDGFVAFLNGEEVGRYRAGAAGERLRHDATATSTSNEPPVAEVLELTALLRAGDNILAIQGLNTNLTSSDLSLIPEVRAEHAVEAEKERQQFAGFRAVAKGDDAAARLAYLDGRLLERAGSNAEAVAKYEEVIAAVTRWPEPHRRLVEILIAQREVDKAESRLKVAFQSGLERSDSLLERFLSLSLGERKRSAREILAALPAEIRGLERGRSGDVLWALRELERVGAIRISCGGGDYRSPSGIDWGHDRFFAGGGTPGTNAVEAMKSEDVPGTEDDPLYKTERYFPDDAGGKAGYHISLPSGDYKVRLHFNELWRPYLTPGTRVFDVRLEGKTVLENYEPAAAGFLKPDIREFEASVEDASLDIAFLRGTENPKISAIEILKAR